MTVRPRVPHSEEATRPLSERRRLARSARQYGYSQNAATVSVFCPLCRARVEDACGPHGGSVRKRLDRVMVEHLEDCKDWPDA